MHHISVDSVEGALELTTQCLCILFYSPQATHVGFSPKNMVIVAGMDELKSAFCASLSHCFIIHVYLYNYSLECWWLAVDIYLAVSHFVNIHYQPPPLWGTVFDYLFFIFLPQSVTFNIWFVIPLSFLQFPFLLTSWENLQLQYIYVKNHLLSQMILSFFSCWLYWYFKKTLKT